jgi:hypothetical protein
MGATQMQVNRLPNKCSAGRFVCCVLGLPTLGLLLWATPCLTQNDELVGSLDTSSLTQSERKVLEHLRQEWTKKYRTTSIGLAAESMRLKLSDDSRMRLVHFLQSNRRQYPIVARHGATTVALTSQEKLIARDLLLRETLGKTWSRPEEVAGELKLPARPLQPRLEFMRKLGIVLAEEEGKDLRYHLADRFPRRPSYRIDFQSHQVEVNGSDKFEVA